MNIKSDFVLVVTAILTTFFLIYFAMTLGVIAGILFLVDVFFLLLIYLELNSRREKNAEERRET